MGKYDINDDDSCIVQNYIVNVELILTGRGTLYAVLYHSDKMQ